MTRRRTFEIPDEAINGAAEGHNKPAASSTRQAQAHAKAETNARRPGPMSTAIRDAAAAHSAIATDQRAAELRSLELAVEFQRLRQSGRVVELIPLDQIETGHLERDRADASEEGLRELRSSIEAHGLSNAVRLERRNDGRYNLIEGLRRLLAFRSLVEAGRTDFTSIPALIEGQLEIGTAYRRMVDENLVREDITIAEHARLALAYAADSRVVGDDVDAAINELYASTNKQTRSEIRQFTRFLSIVGDELAHERSIGRALARDLGRALNEGRSVEALRKALERAPDRDPQREVEILRRWTTRKSRIAEAGGASRVSRTFRLVLGASQVRVRLGNERIVIDGVDAARLDEETVRRATLVLLNGSG